MKKKIIILLSALACLALLSGVFTACTKDKEGGDGTAGDGTADSPTAVALSDYRIVCRNNYTDEEMDVANGLRKAIGEKTGTYIEVTTDFEREGTEFVRTDYEILIGSTNREESQAVADSFVKAKDYGIYKPSTRIVIVGGSCDALKTACDVFVEKYVSADTKELSVADGDKLEYRHEYSVAELTVCDTGIKDFTIVYTNGDAANAKLLQSLILESVGYELTVAKSKPISAKCVVSIKDDTSANGLLKSSWKCSNGALEFSAGKCGNVKNAITDFAGKYLAASKDTVNVEATTVSDISCETDKLFAASDAYLTSLETAASAKKQQILSSTPDLSHVTGTRYYVSNSGNDENNGKSPEAAWATLDKVKSASLSSGDAVLFECGGKWRGQLQAKAGVTYSSYGTGDKPMIIGSALNYANADMWVETDTPNVYKYFGLCNRDNCTDGCTDATHRTPLKNVGNVAFIDGNGNVTMGSRLLRFEKKEAGSANLTVLDNTYKDLGTDLQFWVDIKYNVNDNVDTCYLYVYSASGNPGERFADIEIGERKNIVSWANNATFDGIEVRYTGAHGFGGNASNVTVRNCVVQYIGGSLMSDHVTLYGNAIEVYGACTNFTVENNYINQIYDTGITFQKGSGSAGDCAYSDIKISGNLVERCHWSIEFYNQPDENNSTKRSVKNVEISGNVCRYAGQGWGSSFRTAENGYFLNETKANHICSWGMAEDVENFVISGNTFEYIDGFVIRLSSDSYGPGDKKVVIQNNTYVVGADTNLAKIGSEYYTVGTFTRDTDPTIAVIG